MQCKPVLYIISEALIILVLPDFSPLFQILPGYPFRIPDLKFIISMPWWFLIIPNISLQIHSSLPYGSKTLKNNCICLPGVDQRSENLLHSYKILRHYQIPPDLHSAFPGMTNKMNWEYRIFSWVPLATYWNFLQNGVNKECLYRSFCKSSFLPIRTYFQHRYTIVLCNSPAIWLRHLPSDDK